MKIDEINDINILRNKLKERMLKCVMSSITASGAIFKKDEYYDYYEDQGIGGFVIFDDKDASASFFYNEVDIYFEI